MLLHLPLLSSSVSHTIDSTDAAQTLDHAMLAGSDVLRRLLDLADKFQAS